MYSATITGVNNGIEFTRDVEDTDMMTFHARVIGVVQGMVLSDYHVTNVVTRRED